MGAEWHRWFAWYPVRVFGYAEGGLWRGHRWVWLRWVERTEGHYIGEWWYREARDA